MATALMEPGYSSLQDVVGPKVQANACDGLPGVSQPLEEAQPQLRKVRELEVIVPDGARPGETRLSLSLEDAHKLLVTVPPGALPGDRLVLTEQDEGAWSCAVAGSCRRLSPRAADDGTVKFLVPPNVTPGVTKMAASTGHGETVMVTVPHGAVPGDKVVLSRDPGVGGDAGPWRCSFVRLRVQAEEGEAAQLGPLVLVPTPRAPPPEAGDACRQLFAAARAAGCHVSHKLVRGCAPPLNVPGLLAADAVDEGEELLRIPARFHITPRRAQGEDPELWRACAELPEGVPRGRRAEVCQTAFVARLLHEAEDQAVAAAAGGAARDGGACEDFGRTDAEVLSVWRSYVDGILSEHFDAHPFRLAAADPASMRAAFTPSPEADFFVEMARDFGSMHSFLQAAFAERMPRRRCPSLGMYTRGRFSVLTRVFETCDSSTLVPVVDLFNHSTTSPGVSWRWDAEGQAMVVTADRAHCAGEELCCSYGPRSNVLLYRTYGFTHPPEQEPGWSHIVRRERMLPVYEVFLPSGWRDQIVLDTARLEDSLCRALNSAAANGRDAVAFLRLLCARSRWPYEESERLRPALQALARARARDPASSAWWSELEGADRELAGQESGPGC
ncbi:unnamed protein product [Prorocentrum cordatum]|uniref:SET domain-containing protein n=1 Tax=Prorocentrum cordatum TaxID=2364126 RepID=A0ABN9YK98_9DINO|nr:unnamed protein product [Polarella glacialis]